MSLALNEFAGLRSSLYPLGFTPGSVVTDAILYVGQSGQSNMDDSDLVDYIVRTLLDARPSETVSFAPDGITLLSLGRSRDTQVSPH